MNLASTAAIQAGPFMAVVLCFESICAEFLRSASCRIKWHRSNRNRFLSRTNRFGIPSRSADEESAMVKGKKMPSSEDVAAAGYRAMQSGKAVYIPGFMNWLMAQGPRFVPRAIATQLTKAITKPKD